MIDSWLLEHLACPQTGEALELRGDSLCSRSGARYPLVHGVPVLLRDDVPQTIWMAKASLEAARNAAAGREDDDWFLETLGVSDEERELARRLRTEPSQVVDAVVAVLVAATNGNLYRGLIGRLNDVPVPDLRLAAGGGRPFLDIGCSWGRWSVAAAQKGYHVVGIDPSLGAVMAARRMCARLGCKAQFVVGDARFLPFQAATFGNVFSYSVVQHFSRTDARRTLGEIGRVLTHEGESFIQMPNVYGARCFYNLMRRGFREGHGFEVRFWRPRELLCTFERLIGPTRLSVDCYFGLGLQPADAHLLPPGYRWLIACSEWLRRQAQWCRPLAYLADSVYLTSTRP